MTFEEYVGSRGPALIRLARLLTGDEHRAEDLTQDVLARAYVQWRKIAGADRPDVYVRRVLVNANASWWRRRSSHELAVDTFADRAQRGDLGHDSTAGLQRGRCRDGAGRGLGGQRPGADRDLGLR